MIQYFPKSYERFDANIKVELDLSSNYATTLDLKVATGIDTITLASESDLASLKTKVDNLNIAKCWNVVKKRFKKIAINESKIRNVTGLVTTAALNSLTSKIRYLILPILMNKLLWIQTLQRLKLTNLTLLILLPKLPWIQKPQRLKTKPLRPQVLFVLLNLINYQK